MLLLIPLALAAGAPAQEAPPGGGHYYVRNDTSRHFTCVVRLEHGQARLPFVLRRGDSWSEATAGGGPRRLSCDDLTPPTAFWIQSGRHYALTEARGTRQLILRIVE